MFREVRMPMSEHKPNQLKPIFGLPLVIPVIVMVGGLIQFDAYWSVPMIISAVTAIMLVCLGTSYRVQNIAPKSFICLSIGGIFAAALYPEATLANALLIGSIVSLSIFILGDIQSTKTRGFGGGSGSDVPWDQMIESLQMSENAKRVLFRDRELELLRKTVQADLAEGNFHAALVHCDQMGAVFGAVEEAEALRTQVQNIIHEHHEARILNEIKNLRSLLDRHKWVEAYQDAARLRRLFPESPILHDLEQRIADVRTEYRHGLEDRFLQAAKEDNPEKAMGLLKELDGYLTPDEARNFKDTAATVITTYKENLGARFKMAVSDHRWQEAIEFGEELVKQFPNSKMAEEATSILKTIKMRATEEETES